MLDEAGFPRVLMTVFTEGISTGSTGRLKSCPHRGRHCSVCLLKARLDRKGEWKIKSLSEQVAIFSCVTQQCHWSSGVWLGALLPVELLLRFAESCVLLLGFYNLGSPFLSYTYTPLCVKIIVQKTLP